MSTNQSNHLNFTPQRLGALKYSQGNASTISLSPRARPKRRPYRAQDHSFETTFEDNRTTDEEWTMLDRMRCWRNDAIGQHLYETARFWGDQILDLSGDPNDAFWLAQVHYLMRQFSHAYSILSSSSTPRSKDRPIIPPIPDPIPKSATQPLEPSIDPFAPSPLPKASTSKIPLPPPPKFTLPELKIGVDAPAEVRELKEEFTAYKHESLACRVLAARCLVMMSRWEEALDLVGRIDGKRSHNKGDSDGGVKFEATLCHLRGIIYQNLNSIDRAKESFIEALEIDVKCYESFEALMKNNMLTDKEEWDLVQRLSYSDQAEENAEYVKMMYTIRLKKYGHREEMDKAREKLVTEYGLSSNPDILLGLAEELFTSYRYAECYVITSKILDRKRDHQATLPIHLACMVKQPHLRSTLFVLAHQLVERDPDSAVSWYAVGLWYYSGSRWDEARRFFAKSVLLDSRYGPAWLCYAHCFAHEGEHDQAMTAYMTAQRNMMGNHLPTLFLGMQNIQLGSYHIADQYLKLSFELNQNDPLLLNEMGILAFREERYSFAIQFFHQALRSASQIQSPMGQWKEVLFNVGQAYRKIGKLHEAESFLKQCVYMDPRWHAPLAALGMTLHMAGRTSEAIQRYHEALAVAPADVIVNKLLEQALEDIADDTLPPNLSKQTDTGPFHVPGLASEVERRLNDDVRQAEEDGYKEVLGLDEIEKKHRKKQELELAREMEREEGMVLMDDRMEIE